MTAGRGVRAFSIGTLVLLAAASAQAQASGPSPGSSCTITAVNRNAPVAPDGSFTIYNIPGSGNATVAAPPFRARATCSDGTVGQTTVAFPELISPIVFTGPILWGRLDPQPVSLALSAPTRRLSTSQTAQLTATAISLDGTTRDVTARSEGTTYLASNPLLASVTPGGLLTVLPLFASGSSARVVVGATTEGGVAGSYMFVLGPRGTLRGKVTRADGVSVVSGAQVSVLRHQPMEQAGTVVTGGDGGFELLDVNAGQFTLTVIDPATGDRGKAFATIAGEGQSVGADVRLNGQGTVVVTVVDTFNQTVPNAEVTLTALGAFLDTRTAATNGAGLVSFERVMAGDFTVSTRDRATGLVGTALGLLPVNGSVPLTLKLQPIGTIQGVAFGIDGATLQEGTQVRILSRERGIVTQAITGADGAFRFNPLPLSDGPYTLDAFAEGRLRARVPGLVLSTPNQVLTQNLTFASVGTVSGVVSDASGQTYPGATVTLQMTEGLRFAFEARTEASGRFLFPGVPVGNFTLSAAKDGRTGTAPGRVNADNESVVVNVQLATNSLIGTVFQRDGTTPAPGVTVYLVPARVALALTINPGAAGVSSTTTNALGQFGFPIPTIDSYTLQAESGADRGRTPVVITTIDPANPVQASVTFLAKGTVTGVVRDAAGTPQAGASVRVASRGAFNNSWDTVTDAQGRYVVTGAFVGDITVTAQNSQTRLAGASSGRLLAEGETVTLDVTLAATGRVLGQVWKRDGSVLGTPVRVEISSSAAVPVIEAPNGSVYQFDLVPVGDFTVTATEVATGDKGVASSRIAAASEVKTLNVRLVGQGTVNVRTLDEGGAPVAGAKVTVRTTTPFGTQATLDTGANGEASFVKVPAGDFTVSASKPAVIGTRSGSGSGTLIADQTAAVSITLVSRPVGIVRGTLFGPDGITPRAGMVVRMTPEPSPNAYRTVTDSAGLFEFAGIEGGTTYAINARLFDGGGCNVDRIRAQATGIRIVAQDDLVERNLQMIGAGRVSGHVVNGAGSGVGGIRIRLTNPDPVYGANGGCGGTFYETTSAGDGSYAYPDLPAGNFTVVAENASRTLRAEGNGRVRFDADAVTLDLELVDNAVSMPYTLLDANTMPFDVRGDGSVISGKNSVFSGSGSAADSRGMRLDVVVQGVPVPFQNGDGSIGRLAQNGRELQLDELNPASSLIITRKIFVPRDGYFARYLEELENTSDAPITVGLRLVTNHRGSVSNARVVDTSDGDQILSVLEAENRDRWVIVDDLQDADPFTSGGTPATGHVFDGVGGTRQVASASYELVGTTGKLTWQWNALTVPPGKTVALMHFVFHQLDRYRARQAALRLAQMPPEALEGLTSDERESIVNFRVPAEGTNTVQPLPAVGAGVIQGKVLAGDGVTPVPFATVHFKSRSALYGRSFSATANADGAFELRASTDGSYSALPIPLYTFDIDARHPKTSASTSNSVGDFVPPETVVTKNLVFNGTGNLRGSVRRHSGGLVAGALVRLCTDDSVNCQAHNYDTTQANGTYLLSGSNPADYFLFVQKSHPQEGAGGAEPLRGRATTTITAGDTAVADVVLESTGTLSGFVRAANGDPVEDAQVTLYFANGSGWIGARVARTDTAGRYRFFDVRTGGVRVDARDSTSGADGTATGGVNVDEESFVDVTLRGFGTIEVSVAFARGLPTPDAYVYYSGDRGGSLRTDSAGRGSVSLPVGRYTFYAQHPDEAGAGLGATASAEIATNGQVVGVVMTLKPAGAVKGTIVRPDGSTLAGGFPYTVRLINGSSNQVRGGQTSSAGLYRTGGLAPGLYMLTAYDPAFNRFADQEFLLTEDGEEVQLDLRVEDNRIALPANLFDANRFRFDVQQSGALDTGHSWTFDHGGLGLEIDGQAFTGDTSALLEAGKRQFAISQDQPLSGLKVTRKVFVPRGAYFARYLEVLENPTADPITAEAVLTTKYKAAQALTTSSGDALLTTADQWVALDDADPEDVALSDGQQPPTAHVFAQAAAARPTDAVAYTVGGDGRGTLVARWSGLVVPAGGKVVLMHFAVQQVNRAGAIASAERLVQLPPEAIQSLAESEVQSIVNFAVPAGATSALAPLPPLTGSVSGRVFEGDGVTPVVGVRMSVRSAHPLFNRIWGLQRDPIFCTMAGTVVPSLISTSASQQAGAPPAGTYSLAGRLTDTDSVAMPEGVELRVVAQEPLGCFGTYAGHSWTHIPSHEYRLNASGARDVLFDSGILTGTVTGYADYQVTGGRMYLSIEDPDPYVYRYVPLRSDGTYTYPGMAPGTYDVLADTSHPQGSGLRGGRGGALVTLGATTVTDVPLQPAGALQGAVLTANGEASVNARVQIASPAPDQTYDRCDSGCVPETLAKHKGKQAVSRETRTDSLGRYGFTAVPPGRYAMTVTDPISDGRKTLEVTVTENQVAVQNVILLPLGSVALSVRLPSGQPAVDALVYLYADAQGFEETAGRTNAQGRLTVANIPQGNFTIRVRDPRRPANSFFDRRVSGTITTNGEELPLTVTLLASTTLRVTTTDGDNGNAILPGADIYLQDARAGLRFVGTSDAQGVFSVVGVPEGAFVVEARKSLEGTTAVWSFSGTVSLADDAIVRDLAASIRRTAGSVRATVVDRDTANAPIANADVYLTDSTRFRQYRGRTDAAGQLFIPGVAVGSFTVTARATLSGALQEAEATGTVTAANISQTQQVRPELTSTIVPLPRTIYDANQFPYDVQPNGSIAHGRWAYYGAFNAGAAVLELNGVPFTGASQARLEAGTRQLVVTQQVAGLEVTRKVYVPRSGYFARYLEILDNRTGAPVTVEAKVTHRYYNRALVATSSGDAAVQTTDDWATLDDSYDGDTFRLYYDEAATAHVHGQAGSAVSLSALRFENDSAGYYGPGKRVVQTWTPVTVPANGRVILMHFVVQQVNRAGSRAAAERLVQLPPEAIDAMTAGERDAVLNFTIPADGQSAVAALPPLTGRVEGRAYEGDQVTPARNAALSIKSRNALFSRTWTTSSGTQGEFALAGQITDSSTSVPIPAGGAVQIDARHGLTQLAAPTYAPSFADGTTVLSQNVVFPSGIIAGRVIGPPDYPIRSGSVYMQAYRNSVAVNGIVYANPDGTYAFPGLQDGTHELRLTAYHDQGSNLTGRLAGIVVTAGATATADVPIEPTGRIAGTVRLSSNVPAGPNHNIRLAGLPGTPASRSTYTNAAGLYALSAVPVGTYTLTVTDARNGATVSSTLEVRAGEALTRDIVLSATGTVQLTVNHARGVPAVSAPVYLTAPSVPGERFMGYTSSSGRLDIPAPAGTFSLRATHPRASYRTAPFDSTLTGTLATDGQVLPATLALKAVADVLVSVKNADAANAPIANAQIYITDGRGSQLYWGNTNASGQILLTGVPEGPYTVSASLSDGRSFGRAGTIGTADDGQTVNTTIAVSYQLDVLGALSFEGERRLYAMPASPGDVLSVSAFGEARDGQPALALTHVFVYDPDKELVASGYRYAGAGGYQYSEFGDLASIPAQKSGIYTIAVEAYWQTGPSALGAFRLIAQRSGEPTAPVGYPGGSVEGRVLEADGATPAPSQTVALKTLDALALYVRVIADATGQYRFDGVPLAEYRVAAVDPDVNAEVVRATGTLAAAGVTTAPDLVLPAKSIFTIQVEDGVGNPYGAGVSVEVTDAAPKRTLYTDGAGEVVTVGFGQLTATATYDGLGGSATASAVDGQPVTLVVRLVASSLSGYVLDTAGAPRADRSVYLYRDWWWYLGSAVTSADGSFIFSDVPAGVPLRLVTYDPTLDRDVTLEVTVPPGQQLGNQVLRLATVGSVRGRVQLADGTGLPYRDVLAHYDRGGEGEIGRYASTDESGEYLFDANLPVGKLIRLTSYNYTFNTQAEASVSIAGAGQTAIAPPLVFPGGTLRIRVEDADGTPVLGSFAVYFDRSYLSYSDGSEQLVPGVPPGNHRLELFDYWIWAYVAALDVVVEDGPTTDAPLVVSAVKGQVRHTNGDPVVNGTVYLVTAAGVSYYSGLDADGRYAVHGVAPGDFTVSASDSDSGLFAEVAGSLAGAGTAETLDVALPASGTVTGVFRDGNGSPVPGATVFIRSSGLEYDRYVTTDATGTYLAPHVALGTLTIQAQDPVTSLVAEATGLLDTDQGTVVVDLLSPQGGALTGLLLEIDAVTPVPGALVTLQSVRQQGNFGTYYNAVTTDADGRYLFSPAPAASLLVGAQHPSDPQQAAAAEVTVTAGTTVEQTLVMGTGVRFDYNLDGQDGFRYDVGCEGALGDGGTADRSLQDAYSGAYNLVVNGQSFSCSTVGLSLQAGREVRMGPTSFGSLLVSRRIFVPAAGGYVRFLDEVTNDSAAEVTVPIEISSTLGSWFDTRVLVAPSTVESRYAVTADSLSAPNDPPLAHVLGDGDSVSLAPASTSFQDGSPWVNARWELTIPAGETRSIMTFGVQRRRDGVAAAQAQAESLSGKAEAGMLAGLSPEDRARVRNFTLP